MPEGSYYSRSVIFSLSPSHCDTLQLPYNCSAVILNHRTCLTYPVPDVHSRTVELVPFRESWVLLPNMSSVAFMGAVSLASMVSTFPVEQWYKMQTWMCLLAFCHLCRLEDTLTHLWKRYRSWRRAPLQCPCCERSGGQHTAGRR